jgi:hypothetical protein
LGNKARGRSSRLVSLERNEEDMRIIKGEKGKRRKTHIKEKSAAI